MYKVKNKLQDVRKFRDNKFGKNIYVNAKKTVLTMSPPEESSVWGVNLKKEKSILIRKPKQNKIHIEKEEKKEKINYKEVKTWQQ